MFQAHTEKSCLAWLQRLFDRSLTCRQIIDGETIDNETETNSRGHKAAIILGFISSYVERCEERGLFWPWIILPSYCRASIIVIIGRSIFSTAERISSSLARSLQLAKLRASSVIWTAKQWWWIAEIGLLVFCVTTRACAHEWYHR